MGPYDKQIIVTVVATLGIFVSQSISSQAAFAWPVENSHAALNVKEQATYLRVEQNYVEAVKWFCKTAEQGSVDAKYNLAIYYYNGTGIPITRDTAIIWFKKSAGQDYKKAKDALVSLGVQ